MASRADTLDQNFFHFNQFYIKEIQNYYNSALKIKDNPNMSTKEKINAIAEIQKYETACADRMKDNYSDAVWYGWDKLSN